MHHLLLLFAAGSLSQDLEVHCPSSEVIVTVSPASPVLGQELWVTVTNNSSAPIRLPTSCAFQVIHAGPACSGTVAYGPGCALVLWTLHPGQSRSQNWNLCSSHSPGALVPAGDYSLTVQYYDNANVSHGCCVTITVRDRTGSSYCFGDSHGLGCPCGNTGGPGWGCRNGTFPYGSALTAAGSASISVDTLQLMVSGSTPGQLGLFFQGNEAVNGGLGSFFGDGLRCAGGGVVRLQVLMPSPYGSVGSTVGIAAAGGASPGDLRRYQWWYRDSIGSPCGTGFNLSNGVELTWAP